MFNDACRFQPCRSLKRHSSRAQRIFVTEWNALAEKLIDHFTIFSFRFRRRTPYYTHPDVRIYELNRRLQHRLEVCTGSLLKLNKGSNFDHCEANVRVYVIFYWTLGLCGKKSILQVMFFLAFIPYVKSWHTMEETENFSLYPLRWCVYIYRELLKEKV